MPTKERPRLSSQAMFRVLVKASQLALLEFDRISYQIKVDPKVIAAIRMAIDEAHKFEKAEI